MEPMEQMEQTEQDDRDRQWTVEDWEERIEAAYRRVQQGLPPVPWLPRAFNPVALRRQVRRARAGIIESANPRMSPKAWADTLEQGIVLNMLEIYEERKQNEAAEKCFAEDQQRIKEYNLSWLEVYWALKRLPEANDPTSDVAIQIESMRRELRQRRGRVRKKKGGAARPG